MEIAGARIILTGAASGIGQALLASLASYRARIIAVDRDHVRLVAAVSALADQPAEIHHHTCDLSQPANLDALFDLAVAEMGGVDLFIANAGFAYYEKLAGADWEHLERIYQLNVFSPIYAALKMQAMNGDRPYKVVMTASAMGLLALPGYAIYGSTKAALDRFAEGYRLELGDPSRLMLVYPIGTRTRFFQAASEGGSPQPWPTQLPEQVAGAIVRGIQHDRCAVYPSLLFRCFLALDRLLPFLRRIEQGIERQRFVRWLSTDPSHSELGESTVNRP